MAIAAALAAQAPVDQKLPISVVRQNTVPAGRQAAVPANGSDLPHSPLDFEANEGQTSSLVKFLARGRGFSVFLTTGGATLRLKRPAADATLELKLLDEIGRAHV